MLRAFLSCFTTIACLSFASPEAVIPENGAAAFDCNCEVAVPNVFSPNDDGSNDRLIYQFVCLEPHEFERMRVFDRWGALVFESVNEGEFWNGRKNNEQLPKGVYIWKIEYSSSCDGSLRLQQVGGDVLVLY